jgi:hypothetical protein
MDPGDGLDDSCCVPWTGNGHEGSKQFADDSLDLFVSGFVKDTGEDRMEHLCLNAFCRDGIGSHCLGGTRNAKGRHLVGSDDHTDDANERAQDVPYQFCMCVAM